MFAISPPHLPRRRALAKCDEGVTAIEFAMIAPVFCLMVMGIIEFALIMFTTAVMESATGNTSRLGKTGYIPEGVSRQQAILNAIRDRTDSFLDFDKFTVTSTVYSNFDRVGQPEAYTDSNHNGAYDVGETYSDTNGNGQWDPDMGAAGLGEAGDIVVYTVSYPWTIVTPVISSIVGNTINLTTRAVVKNEPYDVTGL